MAVIFTEADCEVYDLARSVLTDYFSVVATLEPELIIQIRMALDPDSMANLKHHGHPCAAYIKVIGKDERRRDADFVMPRDFPDLRLFIDKDIWDDLSHDGRIALLWHELNHIVPVRDKKSGSFRRDAYGRVKIKLRKDDWMLTGFYKAIELFGKEALEFQSINNIRSNITQLGLSFGDDLKPRRSRKPAAEPVASAEPVQSGEEAA